MMMNTLMYGLPLFAFAFLTNGFSFQQPQIQDSSPLMTPVADLNLNHLMGRYYVMMHLDKHPSFETLLMNKRRCMTVDLFQGPLETLEVVASSTLKLKGMFDVDISSQSLMDIEIPNKKKPAEWQLTISQIPVADHFLVVKVGPITGEQYDYAIISDPLGECTTILARDVDRFETQYFYNIKEMMKTSMGLTGSWGDLRLQDAVISHKNCFYPPTPPMPITMPADTWEGQKMMGH
eukprot:Awhi_evm1s7543